MFSAPELKAQMARKGITQNTLAKELGISPKTLYNKMKTGRFGTDDVTKIMHVLEISDPMPIFFVK